MITVFYDGQCGLCHRSVQFLLKRDPEGKIFRYATLQGETAESLLEPLQERPDSVAIYTPQKQIFVRSDATIHIGKALGGPWAILATMFSIFPGSLRDWMYDQVAQRRYRLFGTRTESCPLLPEKQRAFFLP